LIRAEAGKQTARGIIYQKTQLVLATNKITGMLGDSQRPCTQNSIWETVAGTRLVKRLGCLTLNHSVSNIETRMPQGTRNGTANSSHFRTCDICLAGRARLGEKSCIRRRNRIQFRAAAMLVVGRWTKFLFKDTPKRPAFPPTLFQNEGAARGQA